MYNIILCFLQEIGILLGGCLTGISGSYSQEMMGLV